MNTPTTPPPARTSWVPTVAVLALAAGVVAVVISAAAIFLVLRRTSAKPEPTAANRPPAPPTPMLADPDGLRARLEEFSCDRLKFAATIGAEPDVPWGGVIAAVDEVRAAKFQRYEFRVCRGFFRESGLPWGLTDPAPPGKSEGPLDLPVSRSAERDAIDDAVHLRIDRNGGVRDDRGNPYASMETLSQFLRSRATPKNAGTLRSTDRPLWIHADRQAAWPHVGRVMCAAAFEGFHFLRFAVVTASGEPGSIPATLPQDKGMSPDRTHTCGKTAERPLISLRADGSAVRWAVEAEIVCDDFEPEVEKPKDLEFAKRFLNVEKSVEDPIFKRAEESDHNESADVPETPDNTDFKSDKPFKGAGVNDAIGGGGGRYGTRFGSRKNLVNRGGGSQETEGAVLSALKWLSRHQSADGSWSQADYVKRCGAIEKYKDSKCEPTGLHKSVNVKVKNFDVGVTGLALLAFLGAGYTHHSKETYDDLCFGDVVKNAAQYLLKQQDGDGCVGSRDVDSYMYNHAIAALALSELYGLTGAHTFKEPAQKAVDFLCRAQNPGKGWRYIVKAGENDTSVTGWAVMALKSAEVSGLSFEKTAAYDGARAWFDQVTYKSGKSYKAGYQFNSDADVFIPGVNEDFDQHPTMTAIMVASRIFMDRKRGDEATGGAETLVKDLPRWGDKACDFYYWYWASLALYQFDGPEGEKWRAWNKALVDALVPHQNSKDDKSGSWEPVDRWSCMGGRVYATALNAITLEVYYRYAGALGGRKDK